MPKHPDFSGFDEIVAGDLLRERILRATERRVGVWKPAVSPRPRPLSGRLRGVLAAAGACVLALGIGVSLYRLPIFDTAETPPVSADDGGQPAPPTAVTDDLFQVLAYVGGGEGGPPLEITVNGVDLVLPGVGFDYHPEIVDGVEVQTLSGVVSPDISVQGDDIRSVTYTVEGGTLQYEDPRARVTEDGFRTWLSDNFPVDPAAFADPLHPTDEEIYRALEVLWENGGTLALEQELWAVEMSRRFHDENGRHPSWVSDRDFYDRMYDDFVSRPLDYSLFEISCTYDAGDEFVWITLKNPDNPLDRAMHHGKTIADVRPGEPVTYMYAVDVWETYYVKGENDLRELRDTVTIDIIFKSGDVKTVYLQIRHDQSGTLTIHGSELL